MNSKALFALLGSAILTGCASHYDTTEKFTSTDSKIAQMDARDAKIESTINQVNDSLKRDISRIDETMKREITRVDATHKREVARIDEDHKRDVTRIDETQKRDIARVDGDHAKDVAKLTEDIKETLRIAKGKFAYAASSNLTIIQFETNSDKISTADEQALADFAKGLLRENKNVYLEIRGYTDARGGQKRNELLALNRAEAVRKVLSENGVALHRMSIIALPAKANSGQQTAEDLARNRRVSITIVE